MLLHRIGARAKTYKVPADFELRKNVVRVLIDNVATAFQQFEKPELAIHFDDCRGTLDSGPNYREDCDNELHPTNGGFNKILNQHGLRALEDTGIAKP